MSSQEFSRSLYTQMEIRVPTNISSVHFLFNRDTSNNAKAQEDTKNEDRKFFLRKVLNGFKGNKIWIQPFTIWRQVSSCQYDFN